MEIVKLEKVENKIIEIRGQKVLLDADVAEIYGVETRDINKAVTNNPDKFPEGYVVELSKSEKSELVENFHRFNKLKHSTVNPKAFPEKGLYMLATILKSEKATSTTIAIIETFAKIKKLSNNIKELSKSQHDKQRQNLLQKSGEIISDILYDDLVTNESETSFEINLALLKFKHTIKKSKK